MVSIKIKFRPSSIVNKEGSIYFQLIRKRKVKLLTSGFRVFPEEWDKKKSCIRWDYGADKHRIAYLTNLQSNLDDDYYSLTQMINRMEDQKDLLEVIANIYNRQYMNDYLKPFMNICIQDLEKRGKDKTAMNYRTTLSSFCRYCSEDVLFSRINNSLIKGYEHWLKTKKVALNTISFYMRILRAVYNKAVEMGLACQTFPFKNVYTGIEKTVKRSIRKQALAQLYKLDLNDKPPLSFARDMFLFSFYSRGMSFIDLAFLKRENIVGEYIIYNRHKTGQSLTVKIEPCMQTIIDRYAYSKDFLFPIIKENQSYQSALRIHNIRLKALSQMLHLGKLLTSYVARHSWASIAKQNGIPIRIICEGMGHQNENTTRIYLASLEQSVVDKANAKLLSGYNF